MIDLTTAGREYFGEDYDILMSFLYSTHFRMGEGLGWLYDSLEKMKEFLNKYPKFVKNIQNYLDDKENGWEKYEGHIYRNEKEKLENKPKTVVDYCLPIFRANSINYITKGGSKIVINDPQIIKKILK